MALRSSHPSESHVLLNTVLAGCFSAVSPTGAKIIPVHSSDYFQINLLRADCFALSNIGTAAEHLFLDLRDHVQSALLALRLALGQETQMTDLGSGKQSRRRVGAGGDTGTASDTCRRVHRQVGIHF